MRAVCLDLSTRQINEKVSFVSAVMAALIEVSRKRLLIELNFFSFLQNVNARILLYFQSVMLWTFGGKTPISRQPFCFPSLYIRYGVSTAQ